MSQSTFDENTLGAVPGTRAKRTARVAKSVGIRPGTVGIDYLGFGTMVACTVATLYGIIQFAMQSDKHVHPELVIASWVLFIGSLLVTAVVVRRNSSRLPNGMFAVLLLALGGVVALDVAAIMPLYEPAHYATSSVTVGAALLVLVTLRRARDVLIADAVLGLVLLAVIVFGRPMDLENIAPHLTVMARAVFPTLLGAVVVSGFRHMVEVELDRVLVQSTVSAPRFAVGMLASEELARLDLAAEQLLDGVASASTPLPLAPETASTAASLATELRLHLIEGRRETWLYHAITESEFLGPSVHLVDPHSLAGLLDGRQRDGLLSATWLLLTSSSRPEVTVQLTLGPIANTSDGPMRQVTVPISISTTGVPRARLDPSTREALQKVGEYVVQVSDGSVHLDIECLVDNPADQ
ncbi:hypothetical protein [Planctomonas psychrotolerans]|uniref:hypothetical protein n=1 Tax=Planctomonas psychrotolerans TaxID=2528712 RepID=UPI001238F377|nr:hypothetical protein [Planctomonas psychrotolerans]